MTKASRRVRATAGVLIALVGLLNFHLPHFLLEPARAPSAASGPLEFVFLANLLGAVIAAAAISRDAGWGWTLGLAVVGLSFALYVAQETVGLPGLPQNWFEPSRLLALIIEALFVGIAGRRVAPGQR